MIASPPESHNASIAEDACQDSLSDVQGNPVETQDFARAYRLLRRLGSRWAFPILGMLRREPMRFAKLKRSLKPVSQRMLTLSLRQLERDDLVYRSERPGQPPQVTYGLTPLGMGLVGRLEDFESWLAAHDCVHGKASGTEPESP